MEIQQNRPFFKVLLHFPERQLGAAWNGQLVLAAGQVCVLNYL
jgi:hypothetical protein